MRRPSRASGRNGWVHQWFPTVGSMTGRSVPVSRSWRLTRSIIQDVTLIHQVDLFAGLSTEGYVLINTSQHFADLGFGDFFDQFHTDRLLTCPATEFALEQLGRPLPNAALLGGFAALTGEITLDAIDSAIRQRFSGTPGERNVAAARAAYRYVTSEERELTRASTD